MIVNIPSKIRIGHLYGCDMSDWQKEIEKAWENVVAGLTELGKEVREAWEELEDLVVTEIEQITEQAELIALEFKELHEEMWNDFTGEGQDFFDLEDFNNNIDWSLYYEPTKPATAEHQPACIGCQNYNGTNFNNNLLVCGFHPYGWQEGNCPDWEGTTPTP
jgi:hypothetical protein